MHAVVRVASHTDFVWRALPSYVWRPLTLALHRLLGVQDPDLVDEFAILHDDGDADEVLEFEAVKPWVAAAFPPSRPVKPHPSPPAEQMVLEWVHGYRCVSIPRSLAADLIPLPLLRIPHPLPHPRTPSGLLPFVAFAVCCTIPTARGGLSPP